MAIRYLSGINVDSNTLFVDDANNRVGIGTASPTQALDVTGRAYISSGASIGTTSTAGTGLTVGGSTVLLSFVEIQQGNLLYLYSSGNTYYSQIYQSGQNLILSPYSNVGIGTTSPAVKFVVSNAGASGFEVDPSGGVGGGPVLQAYNRSTSAYMAQSYYALSHTFNVGSGGSTRAIDITSTGNVGIGTTSPGTKLVIVGGDDAAGVGVLEIQTAGGTNLKIGGNSTYSWIQSHSSKPLYINQLGNNVILNSGGGNVGIGTTSPSVRLQVDNNTHNYIQVNSSVANVQTALNVTNSASTSRATLSWEDGTRGAYADLYSSTYLTFTTQSSEKMRITAAGTVAIGNAGSGGGYGIEINNSASTPRIDLVDNSNYTAQLKSNGLVVTLQNNSNNALVFGTNGTERARVTAAGNFGIGTTSPSYKLDVNVASNSDALRVQQAGASRFILNGDGVMTWGAGAASGYLSWDTNLAIVGGQTNNSLALYAGAGEKVRITTGGNVGIGTTSPATKVTVGPYEGSRLPYINGTATTFNADGITVTSYNTGNAGVGGGLDLTNNVYSIGSFSPVISFSSKTQSGTYNNNYAAIYGILAGDSGDGNWNSGHLVFATALAYGASEKMRITNAGNVGIGTTSPSSKLHVSSSGETTLIIDSTSAGTARINLTGAGGGAGAITSTVGGLYVYASGANPITFNTNGSERLRVESNGNVGIGTTSPSSKLHVSGDSYVTGQFAQGVAVASKITGYGAEFRSSNASAQIFFGRSGDSIGSGGIGADETSTFIVWSIPSFVKLLVVNQNGNVGINTDAPSQKLHVAGNVRVTGAYYDSNNSAGSSGQVLSSTGSGTDWVSLSEITGVDGTGTANYVAKWSDTDTITNSQIRDDGTTVGIGTSPAAAKLTVNGPVNVGGRYLYNNFQAALDTTGVNVAGLSASTNGDSAFFTFEAGAGDGQYQRIVYSCYNAAGTWNVVKVIDEGTNRFDVVASASSGSTITFTWKARSGIIYYTPRLIVTGVGSINTSYL